MMDGINDDDDEDSIEEERNSEMEDPVPDVNYSSTYGRGKTIKIKQESTWVISTATSDPSHNFPATIRVTETAAEPTLIINSRID